MSHFSSASTIPSTMELHTFVETADDISDNTLSWNFSRLCDRCSAAAWPKRVFLLASSFSCCFFFLAIFSSSFSRFLFTSGSNTSCHCSKWAKVGTRRVSESPLQPEETTTSASHFLIDCSFLWALILLKNCDMTHCFSVRNLHDQQCLLHDFLAQQDAVRGLQ